MISDDREARDTIQEVVGPCVCATSGRCDFCSLVNRLGVSERKHQRRSLMAIAEGVAKTMTVMNPETASTQGLVMIGLREVEEGSREVAAQIVEAFVEERLDAGAYNADDMVRVAKRIRNGGPNDV